MTDDNGEGGPTTEEGLDRSLAESVILWLKWGALSLASAITGAKLLGLDDSVLFTVVAFGAFAVALVAQLAEGMFGEYGLRGTVVRGLVIIGLVGVLLGALAAANRDDRLGNVVPLSGSFTVAVVDAVPLGVGAGDLDDATLEIATAAYDAFVTFLPAEAVGHPRDLPKMPSQAEEGRAAFANEVATAAGADIVVFADITFAVAASTIQPVMVVNPARIFGAEELAGVHLLGSPILVTSNLRNPQTLAEDVGPAFRQRLEIVRAFVEALWLYDRGLYSEASDLLVGVAAEPLWADSGGEEVVHLFRGNAALLAGDEEAAFSAFSEALQLREGYSRALLGLGEATFQMSSGAACADGVDVGGLEKSIDFFDQARNAPYQPPLAYVAAKADLGAARAYNCIGIATDSAGPFHEAVGRLDAVVADYLQHGAIADVVALAYAELGVANWYLGFIEDRCRFRDAVTAYEAAAAIPARPDIASQAASWLESAEQARVNAESCPG